jgi:hypothetical protein
LASKLAAIEIIVKTSKPVSGKSRCRTIESILTVNESQTVDIEYEIQNTALFRMFLVHWFMGVLFRNSRFFSAHFI